MLFSDELVMLNVTKSKNVQIYIYITNQNNKNDPFLNDFNKTYYADTPEFVPQIFQHYYKFTAKNKRALTTHQNKCKKAIILDANEETTSTPPQHQPQPVES